LALSISEYRIAATSVPEGVRFSVYEAGGRSSVVNASFEVDREL
jgi:hypothetical protein